MEIKDPPGILIGETFTTHTLSLSLSKSWIPSQPHNYVFRSSSHHLIHLCLSVASFVVQHSLKHCHIRAGNDGRVPELALRDSVDAILFHKTSSRTARSAARHNLHQH